MMATLTIGWGLWVMNPFTEAFSVSTQLQQSMDRIAAEWVWGLVAFVVGAAQFRSWMLMVGTLRNRNLILKAVAWRKNCAALTSLLWAFFFIAFIVADNRFPGIPMYGIYVFWSTLTYFRIPRLEL
jgi:hypothetical protein